MMAAGCSFCCMYVAYMVCGIMALVRAYDFAHGCGWWLWATFLAELICVPIGLLLSLAYAGVASASLCAVDARDTTTVYSFMDGCVRGCGFLLLNVLSGVVLGFAYYGLWHETCIPNTTWLHAMALVTFWLCAAITGVNVVLGALEFIKACRSRAAEV